MRGTYLSSKAFPHDCLYVRNLPSTCSLLPPNHATGDDIYAGLFVLSSPLARFKLSIRQSLGYRGCGFTGSWTNHRSSIKPNVSSPYKRLLKSFVLLSLVASEHRRLPGTGRNTPADLSERVTLNIASVFSDVV